MAKLTGDMIETGLHIWAINHYHDSPKPIELVIDAQQIEYGDKVILVSIANKADEDCNSISDHPVDDRKVIYIGDDGVRPYNYDDRCTQVFTTKESCQECIDMLNGRWPNFVREDGIDRDRIIDDDWEY